MPILCWIETGLLRICPILYQILLILCWIINIVWNTVWIVSKILATNSKYNTRYVLLMKHDKQINILKKKKMHENRLVASWRLESKGVGYYFTNLWYLSWFETLTKLISWWIQGETGVRNWENTKTINWCANMLMNTNNKLYY